MANTKPSTKKRRFTSNIIKVIAGSGDNSDEFQVHVDYLKKHSVGRGCTAERCVADRKQAFLQAALNKNWKEGQERKVELPEDEPDIVAAYTEWLYNDKMPASPHQPLDDRRENLREEYNFLEKIQDDSVCDATVSTILAHVENSPAPGLRAMKLIYDGTPQSSPVRLLMSHLLHSHRYAAHMNDENNKKPLLQIPELLFDLAHGFATKTQNRAEHRACDCEIRKAWLKKKKKK